MEINEQQKGNVLILNVDGRLDHNGAGQFETLALQRINDGHRGIIIDFENTGFMASMGIRALIPPSQEMSRKGGRMAIVGLNDSLKQVFAIAGLDKVFSVYENVDSALADGQWPASTVS